MQLAILPLAALLFGSCLAGVALASPGDSLAVARQAAKAHHVAHAVYWVKGYKVFAEQWRPAQKQGWTLKAADTARSVLVKGRKPSKVLPFGHGRAGGLLMTFPGGLVVTYETVLDDITGRYDHVTSILAAPDGQDTLSLNERKDLRVVNQ
jgi:hypothetical protein